MPLQPVRLGGSPRPVPAVSSDKAAKKAAKRERKLVAPEGFPALTERYELYVGDVAKADEFEDESVDCIITDPLSVYAALS